MIDPICSFPPVAGYCAGEQAPCISILTASYNHAFFVGKTIESVLSQSFQDWELIIIDDGSSDRSREIIESYARQDERIRTLSHPGGANCGLPATIQVGLKSARGVYIAFLESDDCWNPECLATRKELMEKNNASVLVNNIELLLMPGISKEEGLTRTCGLFKGKNTASRIQNLNAKLLTHNVIPTFSCVMLRRELLHSCDFASPVPRWVDWWLWLQISRKHDFVLLPEPLTRWRIHMDSYNYGSTPGAYLRDLRKMWNGIQKICRKEFPPSSRSQKFLLACPFFAMALLRLFIFIREKGLRYALIRIKSKFTKKKQLC